MLGACVSRTRRQKRRGAWWPPKRARTFPPQTRAGSKKGAAAGRPRAQKSLGSSPTVKCFCPTRMVVTKWTQQSLTGGGPAEKESAIMEVAGAIAKSVADAHVAAGEYKAALGHKDAAVKEAALVAIKSLSTPRAAAFFLHLLAPCLELVAAPAKTTTDATSLSSRARGAEDSAASVPCAWFASRW